MPNTILKRWNGSAFEELYPKTTVGQISASGTASNTTFLRGDGQWSTAGNLNAQGAITNTPTTVGSGDAIMVAAATGAALQRTTVTFGTGTTTFLRNDGAWSSVTASVALATASVIGGMEIGFTSTETNRAVSLSGNKGLVALPRQIPAVTLNNASNTAPSFYAPTTGQTSSYFLAGDGTTSAPVWRFKDSDWETADQSLTTATDVLTIAIPAAGTYKVFLTGAYFSTSATIGIQAKFTFSGTLSAAPDPVFIFTVAQTNDATSGALHQNRVMNEALTSTSVAATNTDHGLFAFGQFTSTTSGNFSLNIAPETGSTSVGIAEGTVLTVEQVI
jgi:hypothetical protein